jgi:hypothetical protein
MPLLRSALLAAVLAAALPASAAAQPTPARVPISMPSTDGTHYAVWSTAGPEETTPSVGVLFDDQPPGTATTLPAPPLCQLGAASTVAVGYWCSAAESADRQSPILQDPRTGATSVPAVAPALAKESEQTRANGEYWAMTGLGTALVETYAGGNHVDFAERSPLAGGPAVPVHVEDPRRVASLDDPSGALALCAPLRIGSSPRAPRSRVLRRDPASYRAPWLATEHRGRLQLRRCGGHRVRTLGTVRSIDPLVLTGRYLAWAEGRGIAIRRLHDGVTWHVPYRRLRADGGGLQMAGTDHRLWVGRGGNTYMMEVP